MSESTKKSINKTSFINVLDTIMNNRYPRGMGNPARGNAHRGFYIAQNSADIYKFCESNKFTDVYYTAFGFTKYDNPSTDAKYAVLDTIPFDFDSKNLQLSLTDARKLVIWCHNHDIEPRVTFSGNKGFHVFIDLVPVVINNAAKTVKQFCTELSDAAGFTTVDRVIFGDLNRLIRVPNTINNKGALYCIPINSKEFINLNLDDILKMAKEPQYKNIVRVNTRNKELISSLLDISANMPEDRGKLVKNENSKLARVFEYAPINRCRAAEMLVSSGTDEGARDLALSGIIRYYAQLGFSKDAILQKCYLFDSHCNRPMRRSHIEYKVNYHMNKDYSHCTFLSKIDGVCNGCRRKNK